MDDPTNPSSNRLDQIIAEYLAAEEEGAAPSPEDVIAAHPDLAEELRRFFANREEIGGVLPGEPPRRQFVPPKIRYFGDYELLDEIARGGMGVVYKAKQASLNRIVAIKMILSGHLASEEDVKRFRTEAEAAANLKHAGIVPVHEVGVHEDHHYFSMDYIEGRSLAEMARERPLPARRAAEYVRAIAEAVEYAHQQGTLHRDLKPSNILIDGEDQVHVTDFGLAVRVDGDSQLTRTGDVLGTPAYMPPEQALAKRSLIGPASDVYSLGAILYELLTGRPPFKSPSSVELLQQVIEHNPAAPRTLSSIVPRDLETICLKCLRKEPSRRYQTASALADDLNRFLNSEPIRGRPVGRTEKFWLWCRRRPAIAGSLAAILLTACVVGGLIVSERLQNLRHRVEAAVTSVGTAHGDLVATAIGQLEQFPQQMVLVELRRQLATADEPQRLALACALAHFGDTRIEDLVGRVRHAAPEEVENLVAALGHSRVEAVSGLKTAAQTADAEGDWRHKARLALLAMHLDELSLAGEMCELRPDPVQRTWFIEECSTWHGDLKTLAQVAAECDDVPLRTGVAQAAASADDSDITPSIRQAWQPVLSNWYENEPDALTHGTAGWGLRQLSIDEPQLPHQSIDAEWQRNSLGMTLVSIRAGAFVREISARQLQCVELTRPFLLSDREVTHAQFEEFIETCPEDERPIHWEGSALKVSPTERHPVQRVSWFDAILFCNWLSRREGLTPCYERADQREQVDGHESDVWRLIPDANGYRLPTEAEWAYACRAGSATVFGHGNQEALLSRYMVYSAGRAELPGSRLPNAWGLFDMNGNVWEWCHDWIGSYGDAVSLRDPVGPVPGVERVMRGGSYLSTPLVQRGSFPPEMRSTKVGFRVARWHGAVGADDSESDDSDVGEAFVRHLRVQVAKDPTEWMRFYELAALQHFVDDKEGYRDSCREMLSRFIESEERPAGRHELLFAHLFFPSGEVTDEILDLAKQHAADRRPANVRMLGLAFYRRGEYQQARPHLQEAAQGDDQRFADSRITSLLCLALVQLGMDDVEAARENIREAREVQEGSPEEANSPHRLPWGAISSLWREVQAEIERKGLDEPIPEPSTITGRQER